jgi:long-chain acyl-CoA synthetase
MLNRHWLAGYGERIPAEINPDCFGGGNAEGRHAAVCGLACVSLLRPEPNADTDRLSRNFAAYLQGRRAIKKGDRIAVMLPNLPAFPVAMLGIVRAGACPKM